MENDCLHQSYCFWNVTFGSIEPNLIFSSLEENVTLASPLKREQQPLIGFLLFRGEENVTSDPIGSDLIFSFRKML